MIVRPVRASEVERVSALLAEQQADPTRHICYLGMDAEVIAADLADLDPAGLAGVLVAVDGDDLVGALGVERDSDPPRVWWQGPFVAAPAAWDAVAEALLDAGAALLPASVTQQELGPDDRNTRVGALARRRGFRAEEASVVLQRRLDGVDLLAAPAGITVAPLDDGNRAAVAALHDVLFAGAHLPGSRVDEGDDRFVLVASAGSEVVGYVAAEREVGGDGYVDFLGVDEAARGAGTGGVLVDLACRELRDRYGCVVVNLTVRESNAPARRLYRRLGFVEERLIRPWRLGFQMAAPAAMP